MSKKQIVVVGGGAAGAQFAHEFAKKLDFNKYDFTLITKHHEYLHFPATIRTVVTDEGKLEDLVFIPYDKVFEKGKGKVVIAAATSIESDGKEKGGKVVLDNGEKVAYDVLVLATGNAWTGTISDFPPEKEHIREFVNDIRAKVKAAKTIAIAGGGAVGCELAGELKQFYPEKSVVLVHGQPQLLNGAYPDKYRKDVARRLKAKNVSLVLDDYLDNADDPKAPTRKGASLNADLVLVAHGGRPNNAWIGEALGKEVLSDNGYVEVKTTLQVHGHDHIFAMGDMINRVEQKQAFKALTHRAIVAANILPVLEGQQPKKEYNGAPEGILITNGKNGGSMYYGVLWGLMFGDFVVKLLKSKELIVARTRAALGYTA